MTKDRFTEYLQVATREALEFGRQFVVQELSGDVRYKLYPTNPRGRERRVRCAGAEPGVSDILIKAIKRRAI